MQFVCPCLNITINTLYDSCHDDETLKNDLIIQNVVTNVDDFKIYCYNRSDANSTCYVHSELLGVINKSNYSIIKCFMCNMFTHIINSTSNKILVNKFMISDSNEVNNLRKSENYSQLFKIILNPPTLQRDWNRELISFTNNEKLTCFLSLIKTKSEDYLKKEQTSIERELEGIRMQYQNNLAAIENKIKDEIKILNNVITTVVNQFEENKIHKEENVNKLNYNQTTNSVSSKKSGKEIKVDSSEIFDFEVLESNSLRSEIDNNLVVDDNDIIEETKDVDTDDIIVSSNNRMKIQKTFKVINTELDDSDELDEKQEEKTPKYSCSMPQSIPNSFGNRFSLNKANQDSSDSEERSASNKFERITEMASKIVTKDGSELFGERPTRRVPVKSVVETHINHLTK